MSAHSERLPTAPAFAARLRIYQATRRPILTQGEWLDTPWGRARIVGRLGQRHSDVMELLMRLAKESYREADGRLRLLIDPYPIRRALAAPVRADGGNEGQGRPGRARVRLYSQQGLDSLIGDLMSARIEWILLSGERGGRAPLIIEDTWANVDVPNPLTGGKRRLHRLTLAAPWVGLLEALGVWYDPRPIVRMRYGISQATARICLTHNRKKWPAKGIQVATVLGWVGVPAQGQRRADARRRLRRDALHFLELGLRVADGRITSVHGTDASVHGTDASVHGTDASVHGTDASVHGTDASVV